MRLLSRLEYERSFSASWGTYFVRIPNLNGALADTTNAPETELLVQATQQAVWRAIDQLPIDFREIIVLREFEDLSYRQIADLTGIPVGTVMSRLSRARKQLRHLLLPHVPEEQQSEL